MARSILGVKPPQTTAATALRVDTAPTGARTRLAGAELQARLRQKRSSAYVEAMTRLDAGGHVHSVAATEALMEALRQEFPDIHINNLPVGILAKCFLGDDFEVHTLDRTGSIIQHFRRGQPVPNGMDRARALARGGQYAFIEVYTDKLITVSPTGQTAIIDG